MDPRERATAEALADTTSFRQFRKTALTKARQMDRPFALEVRGDHVEGRAGDYLCIDAAGVAYPCAKDVFEQSYVEHDVQTILEVDEDGKVREVPA